MGYTVELVDVPAEAAALRREWHRQLNDLTEAFFDRYSAAMEPYSRDFNLWAWASLRNTMLQFGMLAEVADAQPQETEEPDDESYLEWEWLAQRVKAPGIPLFKLTTNGGWRVVSEEVEQALAAYASAPPDKRAAAESEALWRDWLLWLEDARPGGFYVW